MSKTITNIIKQLEKTNLESTSLLEHHAKLPFFLLKSDAELFYGVCYINDCFVETPFFTVKSVHPDQHSAVFNMLVPYPNPHCLHCMRALIRTGTYITVNLSSFCGISTVPSPICNYFIKADLLKNAFCLHFRLSTKDPSQIIWNSKENHLKNTATVICHYQFGQDRHIKLNIYTKEKTFPLIVRKGIPKAITVPDLRKIDVCMPSHPVEGKLDFILNRKKQTKIYLN